MGEHIRIIPVIALRGMTILPNSTRFFDISRRKSIAALEAAMVTDQQLFLVGQRSPDVADPSQDQLWEMGTIAEVRQLIRLPGGVIRVMVEGRERAQLLELSPSESMLTGDVEEAPIKRDMPDDMAREAMTRVLKDKLAEYGEGNPKMAREKLPDLMMISDLGELMSQIANEIPWDCTVSQEILEADRESELYEILVRRLMIEIQVGQIKQEFQGKVRNQIDKNQKDYVLREQMRIIRRELGRSRGRMIWKPTWRRPGS